MASVPVNYSSSQSLTPIRGIMDLAVKAAKDPQVRYSFDQLTTLAKDAGVDVSELQAAIGGVAVGAAAGAALVVGSAAAGTAGAAALTSGLAAAGSIVGGGMVAGIAVAAAPAVILGIGGVLLVNWWNSSALREEKIKLANDVGHVKRDLEHAIREADAAQADRLMFILEIVSQIHSKLVSDIAQ